MSELIAKLNPQPLSAPEADLWRGEVPNAEVICKYGVSLPFYLQAKTLLDENPARRLFFIEDSSTGLAQLSEQSGADALLADPRVKIFSLETPLKRGWVARKIGQLSAFKSLAIVGGDWGQEIEQAQKNAELLLSDAADFGIAAARHMKKNFRRPLRSLLDLKGSKKGIPAVIVGAGPSLKQSKQTLKALSSKAFLIGAGNATPIMGQAPHLALAICPQNPVEPTPGVPLCIQGRVHPKSAIGAEWFLPDPHFAFESFLTQEQRGLEGGWTVGTTAVAIAAYLGCNPIVLTGFDFCYREGRKYAEKSAAENSSFLIEAVNLQSKTVFTQRDWVAAAQWLDGFSRLHPEIEFFSTSTEGLFLGSRFSLTSLDSFSWPDRGDLALCPESARLVEVDSSLWKSWPDSIPQDLLFDPIWTVFGPILEREMMTDPQPIPFEKKMELQRGLFLEQVIEEHRRGLR